MAYPKKYRDVWVLVNEDSLVTYGWISTRMELDCSLDNTREL